MKKLYINQKEKETLEPFKLGQINILHWLETTFQKEKSELETKRATEIFQLTAEEFLILKTRYETIEIYLYNIKNTINTIKGE